MSTIKLFTDSCGELLGALLVVGWNNFGNRIRATALSTFALNRNRNLPLPLTAREITIMSRIKAAIGPGGFDGKQP